MFLPLLTYNRKSKIQNRKSVDHLGSTSLTTDASGDIIAESRYHPFGEERWSSGVGVTDFTFTSQRADSYMELLEMGARWYDPKIGRWISPDTIVPDFSNPQSLNRLSYVNNRPLNFIDPSGHCALDAQGNISTFDCDLEKFNELSWEERIQWMQAFEQETGVDWYDNIVGILEYFATDTVFKDSEWAKLSDAGVLLAINDGWRMFMGDLGQSETGEAAGLWADFFDAYERNDNSAFSKWGIAEQAGVDYGVQVAGSGATIQEEIYIDTFVMWGNLYRSFVGGTLNLPGSLEMGPIRANIPFVDSGALRIEEVTTPYNSREFVRSFSALVVSPMAGSVHGLYLSGTASHLPH